MEEQITLQNNFDTLNRIPLEYQKMLVIEKMRRPSAFKEREVFLQQEFMIEGIDDNGKKFALQKYHTPFWLCDQMIRELLNHTGFIRGKKILIYNIEFLDYLYRYGIMLDNEIWFINENPRKVEFANRIYIGDTNDKFVVNEFLKIDENMKFDIIVMNPPYQAPMKDKNESGKPTLWDKFISKMIDSLNPDGFLCSVNPNQWREPDGKYKNLQNVMKNKQIHYLELHSIKDGEKTFGASTVYDWYVLQNKQCTKPTVIKDINGNNTSIRIDNLEFIPDVNINLVYSLVAKDEEKKVEILHSFSKYEHRQKWMSKEKNDEFQYPCIYGIKSDGTPSFIYSKINSNGHFGIPKVVFINTGVGTGTFVDYDGKYGLTEFAIGIVDEQKNLENIKNALDNNMFIKNIMGGGGRSKYNKKIISYFRKDFWKEFVK